MQLLVLIIVLFARERLILTALSGINCSAQEQRKLRKAAIPIISLFSRNYSEFLHLKYLNVPS